MAKVSLFFKGRSVSSHLLGDEPLSIGRSQDCDIQIDTLSVHPIHAIISRSSLPESYQIQPAPHVQSLIINHQSVTDTRLLSHGDRLQLGHYSVAFSESAVTLDFNRSSGPTMEKPEPSPAVTEDQDDRMVEIVDSLSILPRSCLQVINGEHLGKTIPLHKSLLRLGLSGNQCAIIAHRSDGYYISHLEGNTYPTVNGEQIEDRSVRLEDGNIIQIGDIQLRFHEESISAAVTTN